MAFSCGFISTSTCLVTSLSFVGGGMLTAILGSYRVCQDRSEGKVL